MEAGASTGRVLQFALRHGLGGVEFLAGVPGTVGGGLIMNAGTYLGEFTDVVTSVRSLDRAGRLVERGHDECGFTYRDSALPRNEIIVSARLALTPRSREAMEISRAPNRVWTVDARFGINTRSCREHCWHTQRPRRDGGFCAVIERGGCACDARAGV